MSVAVITGAAGLVGSQAAEYFAKLGLRILGIDNDARSHFFGDEASTDWNRRRLESSLGGLYDHHSIDVRDRDAVPKLFKTHGRAIQLVIHAAAQPSHDWAAREPFTDFDINAGGTLNLLEATRQYAPEAVFIFTSTNKVYGDTPNSLPLIEMTDRWELPRDHPNYVGIREDMSIDASMHSLFGASKAAADILVQEYGRYFGMKTACFRAGTITGPAHSATELHGFLAYVMKCTMSRSDYTVIGYKGKQVRDAIHGDDLVRAFDCFFRSPRVAEVYNIGGGRFSNASVLEAIELCQRIAEQELSWTYQDQARMGDHIWWIGDNGKFVDHYPEWRLEYDVPRILTEIFEENRERWRSG